MRVLSARQIAGQPRSVHPRRADVVCKRNERVILRIAQRQVVFREERIQLRFKFLQFLPQQPVGLLLRDAVRVLIRLAARAVADGILRIVPVGRRTEALAFLDEGHAIFRRAQRDGCVVVKIRVAAVRAVRYHRSKIICDARRDRRKLCPRQRLRRQKRPVLVSIHNAGRRQRKHIVVVCICERDLHRLRPRQTHRFRRDLRDERAADRHVEIGDLLEPRHKALFDRKVKIPARPVGRGTLRLRIARREQDHLQRLPGRHGVLRAERPVREAVDRSGLHQLHHDGIIPVRRRHVGKPLRLRRPVRLLGLFGLF